MNNENVLILGASSTLGCDLIQRISSPKTSILAHYFKNQGRLEDLKQSSSGLIALFQADLRKTNEIDSFLTRIQDHGKGPSKIVFIPAPPCEISRFKGLAWEHFQEHLDIQLRALFQILHHFLPIMAKAKKGNVVVVGSSYTMGVPPQGLTAYVTAKYAQLGLVKSLVREYGPKGINLNVVSPSMVDTQYLKNLPASVVEQAKQSHPLKRLASPEDIGPVINFLLNQESSYVNGANIPVTGGEIF